jgi:Mg-chelatase subunit ChlD
MNPESPAPDALEVRITALLLGELEGAAAAELEDAIQRDPKLGRLRDRLRMTIELVQEANADNAAATEPAPASARLSESRRVELLRQFKVLPVTHPRPGRIDWLWGIPMAAAAGLIAVLSALNLSVATWDRAKSAHYAAASDSANQPLARSLASSPSMTGASLEPRAGQDVSRVTNGEVESLMRTLDRAEQLMLQPYGGRRTPMAAEPPIAELRAKEQSAQQMGARVNELAPAGQPTPGYVSTQEQPINLFGKPTESPRSDLDNDGRAGASINTSAVEPRSASGAVPGGGPLPGSSFGGGGVDPTISQLPAPLAVTPPDFLNPPENRAAGLGTNRQMDFRGSVYTAGQAGNQPEYRHNLSTYWADGNRSAANGLVLRDSVDVKVPVQGDQPTLGRALRMGQTVLPALPPPALAVPELQAVPQSGLALDVPPVPMLPQATEEGQTKEAKQAGGGLVQRVEEALKAEPERLRSLQLAVEDGIQRGLGYGYAGDGAEHYAIAPSDAVASYGLERLAEAEVQDKPVAAPEPQPEVLTVEQPISTFSLNVSDVSYKLAAASLENGVLPDPSTIRSEEFINAFDYRDPEPPSGQAVALAWERARYPFAHDRELVRLSVCTAAQGRAANRPLNLVLLLDNSGSMERADRVRIIREAMRVLATQIQPQDRVSVVSFARTARLWVDGLPGTQANELPERIGELTPEGGTNLEAALGLAYETAARHFVAGGVNRVVLLTDGAANLGTIDPHQLKGRVESNRHKGIALDCFGIGWEGYNDDLLEILARNGDGRYGFINTPEDAAARFADQLAGALRIAAANVKVQVEFNPDRVAAYRQVGYAKHQLTAEQFRDNTVDAAEIGAAEAGNALYLIRFSPQGQGPLGVVRARYQDPATGEFAEEAWVLPDLGPAPALEASSPSLRLAGAAAAFAEWLARSPFAGDVSPDRVLRLLEGVPEAFAPDPRPQQLREMAFQSSVLAGGSTK